MGGACRQGADAGACIERSACLRAVRIFLGYFDEPLTPPFAAIALGVLGQLGERELDGGTLVRRRLRGDVDPHEG